jgi:ribonucleoside-diphosphate reductase alpha chain
MEVVKRDGTREYVKFEKISSRIKKQTYGLNEDYVDYFEVSKKVIAGLYDGVTTEELDRLAAETSASLVTSHPDYSTLAARIAITSLYKRVDKRFTATADKLYHYINPKTGEKAGMISDDVYKVIVKNAKELDAMVVHDRDFNFDYFGFKTLEKSYLLKMFGEVAETPQHLYMRVAVGIWLDDLEMVQKTYDMLSQGLFTHATPTLFNAGTKRPQLSSCFLLDIDDDSIPGIYKTLSDCAVISQNAGGIGVNIHKIRAKGSYIKGTNGSSNGIVPMLKVFNETARYVDQCFVPETQIETSQGNKMISEIVTGDQVLTSDGSFRNVSKVNKFEKKDRDLVVIKTTVGENIVTDGHLYLAIKNGKQHNDLNKKIQSKLILPEWIEAKNLTTDDILIKLN